MYKRQEQQGAAVPAAEFAPDEQIVQCILGLQTQWEARGLRFDMQLPPLRYRGSETLTYHIWQNLLSNAVKFTPEGGVIHLNGVQYDLSLIHIFPSSASAVIFLFMMA